MQVVDISPYLVREFIMQGAKSHDDKEVCLCSMFVYVQCLFMFSVCLCSVFFYVQCFLCSVFVYVQCLFMFSVFLCSVFVYVQCFLCSVFVYVQCLFMFSVFLCSVFFYVQCLFMFSVFAVWSFLFPNVSGDFMKSVSTSVTSHLPRNSAGTVDISNPIRIVWNRTCP